MKSSSTVGAQLSKHQHNVNKIYAHEYSVWTTPNMWMDRTLGVCMEYGVGQDHLVRYCPVQTCQFGLATGEVDGGCLASGAILAKVSAPAGNIAEIFGERWSRLRVRRPLSRPDQDSCGYDLRGTERKRLRQAFRSRNSESTTAQLRRVT